MSGSDVQVETHTVSGKRQKLASITVRAETSRVRTTRTLLCRNGQYFERFRELVTHTSNDAYIFSVDGDEMLSKRAPLYHWHKMIEVADIAERETRDLVPYSLRHFMITQRIMSGLAKQTGPNGAIWDDVTQFLSESRKLMSC